MSAAPAPELSGDAGDPADGFAAWIAASAPLERPRPEALSHARLSFLSALAAQPVRARRAPRAVRALVLLAAAAAIVLVNLLPRTARWTVRLSGPVRFAEREYAPGEEERLGADLEGSGRLESLESSVRLTLGDELDLELGAGVALDVPPLPELDGLSSIDFTLGRGETYLRTAPSYPGNPIRVETALGTVSLHGTTVGVLLDELGNCLCLCVADGTARLASPLLEEGVREVHARNTLRIAGGALPEITAVAFPPDDDPSPDAAHVRDLVGFFRSF